MTENTSIPFYTRLESLKRKHSELKNNIRNQQNNPAVADYYLKQLKQQKLLVKDQIEDVIGTMRRAQANTEASG